MQKPKTSRSRGIVESIDQERLRGLIRVESGSLLAFRFRDLSAKAKREGLKPMPGDMATFTVVTYGNENQHQTMIVRGINIFPTTKESEQ